MTVEFCISHNKLVSRNATPSQDSANAPGMPDPKTVRDWVNLQLADKDWKGGVSELNIAAFAKRAKECYSKLPGPRFDGPTPVSISFDATDLRKVSQK